MASADVHVHVAGAGLDRADGDLAWPQQVRRLPAVTSRFSTPGSEPPLTTSPATVSRSGSVTVIWAGVSPTASLDAGLVPDGGQRVRRHPRARSGHYLGRGEPLAPAARERCGRACCPGSRRFRRTTATGRPAGWPMPSAGAARGRQPWPAARLRRPPWQAAAAAARRPRSAAGRAVPPPRSARAAATAPCRSAWVPAPERVMATTSAHAAAQPGQAEQGTDRVRPAPLGGRLAQRIGRCARPARRAASRPDSAPMIMPLTTAMNSSHGLSQVVVPGGSRSWPIMPCTARAASQQPGSQATPPSTPSAASSASTARRTWPGVAPTARSSANWRCRWLTESATVPATTNSAMTMMSAPALPPRPSMSESSPATAGFSAAPRAAPVATAYRRPVTDLTLRRECPRPRSRPGRSRRSGRRWPGMTGRGRLPAPGRRTPSSPTRRRPARRRRSRSPAEPAGPARSTAPGCRRAGPPAGPAARRRQSGQRRSAPFPR